MACDFLITWNLPLSSDTEAGPDIVQPATLRQPLTRALALESPVKPDSKTKSRHKATINKGSLKRLKYATQISDQLKSSSAPQDLFYLPPFIM